MLVKTIKEVRDIFMDLEDSIDQSVRDTKIKIRDIILEDKLLQQGKMPINSEGYCGKERPNRKTLCQLKKGHKGSCRALVFWEKEEQPKEIIGTVEACHNFKFHGLDCLESSTEYGFFISDNDHRPSSAIWMKKIEAELLFKSWRSN